jgi:hypothetical protein
LGWIGCGQRGHAIRRKQAIPIRDLSCDHPPPDSDVRFGSTPSRIAKLVRGSSSVIAIV